MSIIYTIYKNRNCRNISYEKSIFAGEEANQALGHVITVALNKMS